MNAWSYFKQHFRQNLKSIIIITAVCCALCMLCTASSQVVKHELVEVNDSYYAYYPTLGMSVLVLCVMSILAPILQFSTFKRRKNLDMWYALPISRRNVGLVHYITGLLMVIIPFTACLLQNILLLFINDAASHLYMPPLIPFYFLGLLAGFVMYSVHTFIFNRANAIIDGIINIALWMFVLPTIFLSLAALLKQTDLLEMAITSPVFSPIIYITNAVETTMRAPNSTSLADYFNDMLNPRGAGFIITTVAGIGAAIGNILSFGKERTERVQEVSDSYFCYRVMIPVYAISAILGTIGVLKLLSNGSQPGNAIIEAFIAYLFGYTFTGFISVVAFIGYIVYRRGFHFKRSDGIVLGVIGALATILPMIIY